MQERRAQVDAEAARDLHDFSKLCFGVGYHPATGLIFLWQSSPQEGHLHLDGVNTLLQIVVQNTRDTLALALRGALTGAAA